VSLGAQHGRDGGGIDSARHGYRDGLRLWHVLVQAINNWQLASNNRFG